MADDNHSVASGGSARSASNEKTECPHCQKEFQTKAVFNHIRTKHPKDLIDSTITKWIGEAEQGAALKVVWFKKNDFDEEEDVTIYACLSSNKTFTTEVRANAHFKKNPDHRKEHVKQMKKLVKDVEAAKKKGKPCPILVKYLEARKANCPHLARIMWRAIQYHEAGCKKLIYEASTRLKDKLETYTMRSNYRNFLKDRTQLKEWLDLLKAKLYVIDKLRAEKCLDVGVLEPHMEWLETFLIAALPLLDGEIFEWMLCVNSGFSVRPEFRDLEEELYYLASSKWQGVEF